jgi:hypothetical protein
MAQVQIAVLSQRRFPRDAALDGSANRRLVARNLGLEDVGKADIWLLRVAQKFDFETVDEMLAFISKEVGDSPGVADLYL